MLRHQPSTAIRQRHHQRTNGNSDDDRLKSLYDNLIRYEIELWSAIALRAECGLQLTGFETSQFLARHDSIRGQDVDAEFAITVGGASKVVDRIEAARYYPDNESSISRDRF